MIVPFELYFYDWVSLMFLHSISGGYLDSGIFSEDDTPNYPNYYEVFVLIYEKLSLSMSSILLFKIFGLSWSSFFFVINQPSMITF